MIKIVTIIGARPQIIKAAALSRAIRNSFSKKINEVIVHTGQHYDSNMSQVFFDELNVAKENYNLNVGSSSHATQTARMLEGIENILMQEKPNCLVVYGDTNSTLAGAIAAAKIHTPVVHIEAGLRSFNKKMPEEINRVVADHCATILFTPTKAGFENLLNEGFHPDNIPPFSNDNPKVFHCGDIMYDNSLYYSTIAGNKSVILKSFQAVNNKFILVTIHRAENTDDVIKLKELFEVFNLISQKEEFDFVVPLHPRTKVLMQKNQTDFSFLDSNSRIKIIEPVSFLDMIMLESNAQMIMTDSGGVQKEAFFFKKPCIILREETEWVELVECNTAILAGVSREKIIHAFNYFKSNVNNLRYPNIFGDGHAAEFICEKIIEVFS